MKKEKITKIWNYLIFLIILIVLAVGFLIAGKTITGNSIFEPSELECGTSFSEAKTMCLYFDDQTLCETQIDERENECSNQNITEENETNQNNNLGDGEEIILEIDPENEEKILKGILEKIKKEESEEESPETETKKIDKPTFQKKEGTEFTKAEENYNQIIEKQKKTEKNIEEKNIRIYKPIKGLNWIKKPISLLKAKISGEMLIDTYGKPLNELAKKKTEKTCVWGPKFAVAGFETPKLTINKNEPKKAMEEIMKGIENNKYTFEELEKKGYFEEGGIKETCESPCKINKNYEELIGINPIEEQCKTEECSFQIYFYITKNCN